MDVGVVVVLCVLCCVAFRFVVLWCFSCLVLCCLRLMLRCVAICCAALSLSCLALSCIVVSCLDNFNGEAKINGDSLMTNPGIGKLANKTR